MRSAHAIATIIGLLAGAVLLAAPDPSPGSVERILWVAHYRIECPDEPARKCLLIKDDHWATWSPWLGEIEGFDYREGFAYEIRVRDRRHENPTSAAGTRGLQLIEVLSRIEGFEVAAPATAPATAAPPRAPSEGQVGLSPKAAVPEPRPPAIQGELIRGRLTVGDGLEARAFRRCGDGADLWIEDATGRLWQSYRELAPAPNRPVYLKVWGHLGDAPATGFGSHYGRQVTVIELLEATVDAALCDADRPTGRP